MQTTKLSMRILLRSQQEIFPQNPVIRKYHSRGKIEESHRMLAQHTSILMQTTMGRTLCTLRFAIYLFFTTIWYYIVQVDENPSSLRYDYPTFSGKVRNRRPVQEPFYSSASQIYSGGSEDPYRLLSNC